MSLEHHLNTSPRPQPPKTGWWDPKFRAEKGVDALGRQTPPRSR